MPFGDETYKSEPNSEMTSAAIKPVRSSKIAAEYITNESDRVNSKEVLLFRGLWLSRFFWISALSRLSFLAQVYVIMNRRPFSTAPNIITDIIVKPITIEIKIISKINRNQTISSK